MHAYIASWHPWRKEMSQALPVRSFVASTFVLEPVCCFVYSPTPETGEPPKACMAFCTLRDLRRRLRAKPEQSCMCIVSAYVCTYTRHKPAFVGPAWAAFTAEHEPSRCSCPNPAQGRCPKRSHGPGTGLRGARRYRAWNRRISTTSSSSNSRNTHCTAPSASNPLGLRDSEPPA